MERVFAFSTTKLNPPAAVHPKAMPVILLANDRETWQRGEVGDPLKLQAAYPLQPVARR